MAQSHIRATPFYTLGAKEEEEKETKSTTLLLYHPVPPSFFSSLLLLLLYVYVCVQESAAYIRPFTRYGYDDAKTTLGKLNNPRRRRVVKRR